VSSEFARAPCLVGEAARLLQSLLHGLGDPGPWRKARGAGAGAGGSSSSDFIRIGARTWSWSQLTSTLAKVLQGQRQGNLDLVYSHGRHHIHGHVRDRPLVEQLLLRRPNRWMVLSRHHRVPDMMRRYADDPDHMVV